MKPVSRCFLFAAVLLAPASADAQTVRGEVVEAQTGQFLDATVIAVLDAEGAAVLTVITSDDGRFVANLPGAGQYRLRIDRIGYESVISEPFSIESGDDLFQRLEIDVVPVELDAIEVSGDRRCVVRPGPDAQTTARIWEQARIALAAATATQQQRMLRFDAEVWSQELDARSLAVVSEQRAVRRNRFQIPFGSLPAEELIEDGFIQSVEDGRYFNFYAPTADVLLSDAFLDTHCFRTEFGEGENEELIGLHFEPVGRRDVADVTGTLWLDRATSTLRFAEMQYVARDRNIPTEGALARVDFEALPGGRWIARRWTIRMPQMVEQRIPGAFASGMRRSVGSFLVEGGEVTRIADRNGRPLVTTERYSASGVVYDSLAGGPLTFATVNLNGTSHTATTDGSGRFTLEELPAGRYAVRVEHPRLDSLPAAARPPAEIEIRTDDVEDLEFAVPTLYTVVETACPGLWRAVPGAELEYPPFTAYGDAILTGLVIDSNGEPVVGATASVTWTTFTLTQARVAVRPVNPSTTTDREGRFMFCGVPSDQLLSVQAMTDNGSSAVVETRAAGRFAHAVTIVR